MTKARDRHENVTLRTMIRLFRGRIGSHRSTTRDETFTNYQHAHFEVVYYESIKRESKTRRIYEGRCDERLKTKADESTRLAYTTHFWLGQSFVFPERKNKKIKIEQAADPHSSEIG